MNSLAPPKPRTRPAPSERDQRIYFDYQTAGKRQTELAADYKLTQSRVSQIIRRVEAWVQGSKFKPSTGDDAASKTTSNLEPGTLNLAVLRRLEFERLNFTVREAMRHFRDQHKTITHKHGTHGEKSVDETTERTIPPSIQCLKVVLQATRQLSDLADKPPLPTAAQSDEFLREQTEAWLTKERDQAEREGRVSRDPNNRIVIRELVRAVRGEPNSGVHLHILARDVGMEIIDPAERRMGCQSGAMCGDESDFAEAPAESTPPAKDASSTTCAPPHDSPQPSAAAELAAQERAAQERAEQELAEKERAEQAAAEKKLEQAWNSPPPPVQLAPGQKPRSPFEDPVERRRRHQIRLQQLREARANGRMHHFHFYADDGPMP